MSDIVIYEDRNVALDAMVEGESVWLRQKQIAELFDVKVPAVSKHLKNIFKSGELDENVVVSKMETTTQHGAVVGVHPKGISCKHPPYVFLLYLYGRVDKKYCMKVEEN